MAATIKQPKQEVPVEVPVLAATDHLGMTAHDHQALANQEKETRDWLKAQPKQEVFVPRSVVGDRLVGTYNGIRYEVVADKRVRVPQPIAELIQARVDGDLKAEATAQRASQGR